MLVQAYGEHALGRTRCNEWFNKLKSGRPPKKCEDVELQALLDEEQLSEQLNVDQSTVSRRLNAKKSNIRQTSPSH